MKSFLQRASSKLHLLIFAVFTIMQGSIIDKIVLFGDDYYYTSFFYNGAEYFFGENAKHWLETNGRALVHLLDEFLLAGGTIILWKIFAVIVISLIAFFTALIASRAWNEGVNTESFKISLVISCACVAFISILTANQTLYWATGFLNYVWPILLTLSLFYFTESALKKGHFSPWFCPLAFLACASTEQNAFASLCILIFAALRMFSAKKKPNIAFWTALLFGILGIISLFAAPGNAVRTTYYKEFYDLTLIERITDNIFRLISLIFRHSGASIALVLFFGASGCGAFERLKGLRRLLLMSVNALAAVLLIAEIRFGILEKTAIIIALSAFFIDIIISISLFLKTKDPVPSFFTVMAAVMQGAMLVSPEMGPRTVIVSVIFLIIPTAFAVSKSKNPLPPCLILAALMGLMTNIGHIVAALLFISIAAVLLCVAVKKLNIFASSGVLLILTLLMLDSLSATLTGYNENYAVHKENARLLTEYRQTLETDNDHILIQKYLPNGTHKYTMPYDDPYHMYWFKIAMKLPVDTTINYE